MIKFIQHSSPQYPPRTYENASADATIAFAFNFHTPGEILTKDSVRTQGKLYLPIKVKLDGYLEPRKIDLCATDLSNNNVSTLNIAGNQLVTALKNGYNQHAIDEIVYQHLYCIFSSPEFKTEITLIRSGGQSGFDEAGLKAAVRLGIPALCLCPKGWRFADANGNDVRNEEAFKNRFPKEFVM